MIDPHAKGSKAMEFMQGSGSAEVRLDRVESNQLHRPKPDCDGDGNFVLPVKQVGIAPP